MEFNTYNIANNTLKIFFRNLPEPIYLSVDAKMAVAFTRGLVLQEKSEDVWFEELYSITIRLSNGYVAWFNTEHILLAQHLFDFGTHTGPPPSECYGDLVTEEQMDEWEWAPPLLVVGVARHGIVELSDQSPTEGSMLADYVELGSMASGFIEFEDDDGETNVVASDAISFVILEPEYLSGRMPELPRLYGQEA